MSRPSQRVIRIGDCLLDLEATQLLRNDAPVHVRAKTFGVLRHLALNPGRVIGKDELFDTLWPGLSVTEDTLTQSVREFARGAWPERGLSVAYRAAAWLCARPCACAT